MQNISLKNRYISSVELHNITGIGISQCRKIMKTLKAKALEEGYFIPVSKGYIAPYEVVRRFFKWK